MSPFSLPLQNTTAQQYKQFMWCCIAKYLFFNIFYFFCMHLLNVGWAIWKWLAVIFQVAAVIFVNFAVLQVCIPNLKIQAPRSDKQDVRA